MQRNPPPVSSLWSGCLSLDRIKAPNPRFVSFAPPFHSFSACSERDITLTRGSQVNMSPFAHLRRRRKHARLLRRGLMANVVLFCTSFAKEKWKNWTNRCFSAGCGDVWKTCRKNALHYLLTQVFRLPDSNFVIPKIKKKCKLFYTFLSVLFSLRGSSKRTTTFTQIVCDIGL